MVFAQWLGHASNLWETVLQVQKFQLDWAQLDSAIPSPGDITGPFTVAGCVCSIFPAQAGLCYENNEACTKQKLGTYLFHIVNQCLKYWEAEFLLLICLHSESAQLLSTEWGRFITSIESEQPMGSLCKSC